MAKAIDPIQLVLSVVAMSVPWRKARRTPSFAATSPTNHDNHHHPHYHSDIKLRYNRNMLVTWWKQRRLKLLYIFGSVLFLYSSTNLTMRALSQLHPEDDEDFMALESVPLRFQNVSVGAPQCRSLKPEDVSYTLVTQTSENRLWMMEEHCQRWGQENPISIAVYSTKPEDTLLSLRTRLRRMGCLPGLLKVQLLSDVNSTLEDYPINVLRNMALRAVQTSHVAYIDMDFWESVDLYDNLMLPHIREHLAADPKAAIVIPAFMFIMKCKRRIWCRPLVPRNRTELLPYLEKKTSPKVTYFGRNNVGAHGTTRYDEWVTQSAQELLPIPCTESNRYEPYLVVRWCDKLPPFQEIFTGYGKNKISWVMHLRRAGWTMHQLGESFVVHYPHLPSDARVAWDGGSKKRKMKTKRSKEELMRFLTDKIFIKFKHWLMTEVPDEMRLEGCATAENDDSLLWNKKSRLKATSWFS